MSLDVSDAELLEITGENDIESITDLNLRGHSLTSFLALSSKLPNLTLLSFSHNKLTNTQGFGVLQQLQYVNLNSNSLTSIEELKHCPRLEELHASNNKIKDLQPLAGCSDLRFVSLFSNCIPNLEHVYITLQHLPNLRQLDLAGNPCAQSDGYKQEVLLQINLRELDGEPVAITHRPSAGSDSNTDESSSPSRPQSAMMRSSSLQRPSTAPIRSSSCKLFSAQFLNTNPVLLQYLAKSYLSQIPQTDTQKKQRKSFVHKLRHTAAKTNACEELDPIEIAQDPTILGLNPSSIKSIVDLDDPYELLKHMLMLCEQLQQESEKLQVQAQVTTGSAAGAGSDDVSRLQKEVRMLRLENSNMEWLQLENRGLRAKLAALTGGRKV